MPQDENEPLGQEGPPPQHQERQPGVESEMEPRPQFEAPEYRPAGKLENRIALVTGGDSGIGRAVAVYFAKEGADVAIVYLEEHDDARETERQVREEGRECLLLSGDVGDAAFCRDAVTRTVDRFGKLDVLVNNAGVQYEQDRPEDISDEQFEHTFRTNIFGFFYITKAALPHLGKGSTIVNSTSITAFRGSSHLMDYAATKGAILSFTRSLASNLAKRGIRVNAVAPGPIWTPLIPASFSEERVSSFGTSQPLGRPGQPEECAPAYVYLACEDSSYVTGQTVHVNGGEVVGG